MADLRVVAVLATYNERRFVGPCIEHFRRHGVETYLIDNCSDDGTVEIAERYLGEGLLGIETLPRESGAFSLVAQMRRKEEAIARLDADWLIHADADELRLPPPGHDTLTEALEVVDEAGYNAINFTEYTFVPTQEEPDHDDPGFQRTLRTYYPFCPAFPHRLSAWQTAAAPQPDLASSGGHRVGFPGLRMYPVSFPMKHYLFLSVPHAIEKYVQRAFDPGEVRAGWHGWRARLAAGEIRLPSRSELRVCESDDDLDGRGPRERHYLDELTREPASAGQATA